MIAISHWYGRLGNNIQQCAVGTMAAALTQSTFESIDHEIIRKHKTSFGQNSQEVRSKFFYWEGPYKEVNIEKDIIYENMRQVCKTWIGPQLDVPTTEIPDDTIVIHIRSGDIFDKDVHNPEQYSPNPYYFYTTLLESFEKAIVVTENDNFNPIVEQLSYHSKVTIQRGTVAEDFATLLGAKHVANSGVGTFAVAAVLCSQNIENFYCTDVSDTEQRIRDTIEKSGVEVDTVDLSNMFDTLKSKIEIMMEM